MPATGSRYNEISIPGLPADPSPSTPGPQRGYPEAGIRDAGQPGLSSPRGAPGSRSKAGSGSPRGWEASSHLMCLNARLLLMFSCSVVSDSLQPHGLQYSSLFCPLLSPKICSNSCPSSWRCYLTISSSVAPFSSCPQSFPASGSFPMS